MVERLANEHLLSQENCYGRRGLCLRDAIDPGAPKGMRLPTKYCAEPKLKQKLARTCTELEFLAMILQVTQVTRKNRDTAMRLMRNYGSLIQILGMAEDQLARNDWLGADGAACIVAARRIIIQGAAAPLASGHILSSRRALFTYLQWSTLRDGAERVRLLSLGASANLILDETIVEGEAARRSCQPQTIMLRALERKAVGLIVVHPSLRLDPADRQRPVRFC